MITTSSPFRDWILFWMLYERNQLWKNWFCRILWVRVFSVIGITGFSKAVLFALTMWCFIIVLILFACVMCSRRENVSFLFRLNDNSILRLCGLKTSQIRSIYLDDNSVGNAGLQFLLITLLHNSHLLHLSIRNNAITDNGVMYIYDYLGNTIYAGSNFVSSDV